MLARALQCSPDRGWLCREHCGNYWGVLRGRGSNAHCAPIPKCPRWRKVVYVSYDTWKQSLVQKLDGLPRAPLLIREDSCGEHIFPVCTFPGAWLGATCKHPEEPDSQDGESSMRGSAWASQEIGSHPPADTDQKRSRVLGSLRETIQGRACGIHPGTGEDFCLQSCFEKYLRRIPDSA